MEPQKRAEYSKPLEADEIEEVIMDEESDKELEEADELMEPRVQSSSYQKMKIKPRKPKLRLRLEEPGFVKCLRFYWTSKWRQSISCLRYKCRILTLFILHSLL